MKRFIGSIATISIACLLMNTMANAQVTTLSASMATREFVTVAEAKANARAVISKAKAERNFQRNFRTSANVRWINDNTHMRAYYKENGVQTRITYDHKGRWFRTMKTYGAEHLQKNIAGAVKRKFKGYKITCVNDVQESGMHCYFLNIIKDKDFKQVIYYDGELKIHQDFTLQ